MIHAIRSLSDILGSLIRRLARSPGRIYFSRTVFLSFINGGISIAVMASLAAVTHTVFIFPSLGPTAFLFFSAPLSSAASPRNTIIGHAIGIVVGYLALVVTGLTHAGPALTIGITGPRIIASSLSLAATSGLMALLRVNHAPAAATTLLVALGILPRPPQLVVVMLAVLLLTLQAYIFNHLVGIPYPRWKPIAEEKLMLLSGPLVSQERPPVIDVPRVSEEKKLLDNRSLVVQYKLSKKYHSSKTKKRTVSHQRSR